MIREAAPQDLPALLELYRHLHSDPIPGEKEAGPLWARLLEDPCCHIIVAEKDGRPVSTCTVFLLPNLTHGGRPYGLVENVATLPEFRGKGLATACLDFAADLAVREHCYKLMLLTGSKQESTLRFYERAGYNRNDKTAFVRWFED